jgi:hypothetical protein
MMRPTERQTRRKRRSIVVVAGRASFLLLLQPGGRVRWCCSRSAPTLACMRLDHISYTTSNSLSDCYTLSVYPALSTASNLFPTRDLHGLN